MAAPDSTAAVIARLGTGIASSAELEQAANLSQTAMSRLLRDLIRERRALRIGSRRGARYALRREVRDTGSTWPLHRVDRSGALIPLGQLHALAADQYYFEPSPEAEASGFAWAGVTTGLPYFLQDQRPGGFLGRAVPRRYPELALPQRVIDWSDEHYLRYLTARGSDTVGDLILGAEALDYYLAQQRERQVVPQQARASQYPGFAREVMEGGLPGSSAQGEHPKFTTLVQLEAGAHEVLVKFSPPIDSDVGQRWSDLLVAEHLSLEVLRTAGIDTPRSQVLEAGGRQFLEVTRFDRHGAQGRIGVSSLLAIDMNLYGQLDNWIAAATRLHRDGRIDEATLETVRFLATFGALIANTDRHFGNLAFLDRYDGRFAIAPVYDMLPMLFAPQNEQLTERAFVPPSPTSDTLRSWSPARAAAEDYWRHVSRDPRISSSFRSIADSCAQSLMSLPRTGAYA